MPNTIITPTAVTREALNVLHQKLNFVGSITRDYDKNFAKTGAKIGTTLNIRQPNQYVIRNGATLSTQDTVESTVALNVTSQKGVDLNFTSVDLTMNLDDFSKRIIEPAMSVLAANIEADAMNMALDVYQQVNNQGAAITLNKALTARKRLQDSLAPSSGRTFNLNTQDNLDLVDSLKGLFNPQEKLSKNYTEGYMGRAAGFDFAENTLWPNFTPGARSQTYQVNGAGQTGSTLAVNTGTGAIAKGEVFTIAGLYEVHPESKVATTRLQQFVVTAAYAGGNGNIAISPAIVTTGAAQNVAASPATTSVLTFAGTASTTHGLSLAYQEGAFAFATADLLMPDGVDWKAREVFDGISMRIVRAYDINNDKFPCRLDVLYGYKTLRAGLAVRSANN